MCGQPPTASRCSGFFFFFSLHLSTPEHRPFPSLCVLCLLEPFISRYLHDIFQPSSGVCLRHVSFVVVVNVLLSLSFGSSSDFLVSDPISQTDSKYYAFHYSLHDSQLFSTTGNIDESETFRFKFIGISLSFNI